MYEVTKFADCDINDQFFDTLKNDYPTFCSWFKGKSESGTTAFVSKKDGRIQAFVYVKEGENEAVGDLPPENRIKIGTFKTCSDFEGQRLGEGGIGLALWVWQRSNCNQIYLTVYPKHDDLIGLLERFGFFHAGFKGDELVYVKDKRTLSNDGSEKAGMITFPYIDPDFRCGVYIPIKARFHDNMFQYSKLHNTVQITEPLPVANGITKAFIATPKHIVKYRPGDFAFVYRISDSDNKSLKSVVTSYCTVSTVEWFKAHGKVLKGKDWNGFVKAAGNKTVYDEKELRESFSKQYVCIITLIYNGYFGNGMNINNAWLRRNGLFDKHPYENKLTREQVYKILREGGIDESFVTFNKSGTRDKHNEQE